LRYLGWLKPLYPKLWTIPRYERHYSTLTNEQTFQEVYRDALWGCADGQTYCSGLGSQPEFTAQYCDVVRELIKHHRITTVIDLGCGDFRVGRQIASPGLFYTGIDVVPELIDHNRAVYSDPNVAFHCMDITRSDPPRGELCLIRQVLQHLSNSEIEAVLLRCKGFKYVLVTEHVPIHCSMPNIDKVHGPHTRLHRHSGVFLNRAPFSRQLKTILNVAVDKTSGLRTDLLSGV
jgi:SAM-dependent methyltransferase